MTQRSEEEARRLWRDGLMLSGTIYWQEGMSDWKPVTQWLGEYPVASEKPVAGQAGVCDFFRTIFSWISWGITKFLQRLLWI